MNWEKLRSSISSKLANLFFRSFCKLGKRLKYSLTPTFQNPSFESKDELNVMLCPKLGFTIENKGDLHKIRLVKFQT